jgi:hypothetical protein
MEYEERYSDRQLAHVIEQGLIYMCACPAQVAEAIQKLRQLYRYQMACLASPLNDSVVHQTIARSTIVAHATLQDCLTAVIVLEQWDPQTLTMPENLRERQMRVILSDD